MTAQFAVEMTSANTEMLPGVAGKPAWPPIPLTTPTITVGRTDSNTIQIQHASISRTHLKLTMFSIGWMRLSPFPRFTTIFARD